MAGHLREDRLIDLVWLEAEVEPADRQHLAACPACAARLEEARAGWRLAREVDVPEPSPLYWQSFRRQVGERIGAEPARRYFSLAGWWPALAAAAAVAVVAIAVGPLSGRVSAPPAPALLPAWSPLPPPEEDETLGLLGGAAVVADEAGLSDGPRDVASLVASLSDEESQALAEALRREMGAKAGS